MDAIRSCDTTGCYPRTSLDTASDPAAGDKMMVNKDRSLAVDVEAAPKPAATEDTNSSAELNYKRSEKTSLFIKTQDGDVVRIRIKAREAATAEVSVSDDGESKLTELELKSRESVRIGVFVKGDLDAGELEAIQSVVEQAGTLANDFFSGDTSAAFAAASGLEIDGQELAKVALRLRVSEQFSYAQSGPALPALELPAPADDSQAPAEDTAAGNDTPPAAVDTSVRIATSTSARLSARVEATPETASNPASDAVAPPAADTGAAPAATDIAPPAAATPTPVEVADDSPAEEPVDNAAGGITNTFELLGTIFGFLSNLIESLNPVGESESDGAEDGANQAGGNSQTSVSVSLKFRIFGSIVTSLAEAATTPEAESPDQNQAALATLNDAVDTLAAESEPPYEAVA